MVRNSRYIKTDVEVKKKIESLLASFRQERQRKGTIQSGAGTDEVYPSKWFAYKNMGFSIDKHKLQKTKNTSETISI